MYYKNRKRDTIARFVEMLKKQHLISLETVGGSLR